jgi:hypothetical protein
MLTLAVNGYDHNCQGFCRREFLAIGGLGILGGLTLPGLLRARSAAPSSGSLVKDKAVVLLFLQGGPSHIEFFDPKMEAPAEVRSITGETQTCLPGITFGGTFSKLAQLADDLVIVRSYASGNANHTYQSVASGGNALRATAGALYAKVAGTTNPRTGVPNNILVLPEAVRPGLKLERNFETDALPTLTSPGELGPTYGAFDPSGGGQLRRDMELKVPPGRFEDRRLLLRQLDHLRRVADVTGQMEGADEFRRQAFDVITRGVANAFDLAKEDPKTLARYDTSQLFRLEDVTKWFDMRRASNLLGKQMLLARRLCEAGCGFVTVSDCGWDMHANRNSPENMAGIVPLTQQVDHAVSAFIEDVHERGLSDRILLVITGEMGRTPRRNKHGGRDHYANLTTLALAGGGLKTGQVIGKSDRTASSPTSERYTPQHLLATILDTVLDIGEARLRPSLGKLGRVITDGEPISGLS